MKAFENELEYRRTIGWANAHGYDYHGGADKLSNGREVSCGIWLRIDADHTLEAYLHYIARYAPHMAQHTYSF